MLTNRIQRLVSNPFDRIRDMTAPADDSSSACLSDDQLHLLLLGELDDTSCDAIGAHLDQCDKCLSLFQEQTAEHQQEWMAWQRRLGEHPSGTEEPLLESPPALPEIPGYELLEELGRGGMGVVFRARHRSLNREVALKMLLAGALAGPERMSRLRGEAELVAKLKHLGIVQIYDVGEHAGLPYLSLELVAGPSLADVVAGKPQPVEAAAKMVEKIARAAHFAHQNGIIHRDLKPANVLLDTSEIWSPDVDSHVGDFECVPKIADFGLAKHGESLELTATGQVLGTPHYMAPEQIQASAASDSVGVDVYSIGAILYELLTGRPPLQGASAIETIQLVISSDPIPPRMLNPLVPRDLQTICLKCLEKSPAARYSSAAALADDLRRWLAGHAILARPVGRLGRAARWCRRNPAIAALSGMLLTILCVGVAVLTMLWQRAEQANDDLRAVLNRQEKQAYLDGFRLSARQFESGDVVLARQTLDSLPRQHRRWEWQFLNSRWDKARLTCAGHRGAATAVVFLRRGTCTASGGIDGKVRIWNVADGTLEATLDVGRPVLALACRDAADTLAVGCEDGTVQFWNTQEWQRIREFDTGASGISSLVLHQQATTAYTIDMKGNAAAWETGSGQRLAQIITGSEPIAAIAFDDERQQLYLAAKAGNVFTCGREGANVVEVFDATEETTGIEDLILIPKKKAVVVVGTDEDWVAYRQPNHERFAADYFESLQTVGADATGEFLATGSANGQVVVWHIGTSARRYVLSGHQGAVTSIAFHPSQPVAATTAEDGQVKIWPRIPTGWTRLIPYRRIPAHDGPPQSLAVSPDGRFLATTGNDRRVIVWNAASEKPVFTFPDLAAAGQKVAFSRNGRWLAAGVSNDTAIVWEFATRQEQCRLSNLGGPVSGLTFSHDNSQLITRSDVGILTVWDIERDRLQRTVGEQRHVVRSVECSADGTWLAAKLDDNVLQVWNAKSWEPVFGKPAHKQVMSTIAFSPDSRVLATSGRDATVHLWEVPSGQRSAIVALRPEHRGKDRFFSSRSAARQRSNERQHSHLGRSQRTTTARTRRRVGAT